MTEVEKKVVLKPFHESIVDALDGCVCEEGTFPSDITQWNLLTLFGLIETTYIPKGHDKIIAMIEQHFDYDRSNPDSRWSVVIREVLESLRAQKQAEEEKEGQEKPAAQSVP